MGSSALKNPAVFKWDDIEEGVRLLREGGVVAYPTDTVYGLGADIASSVAVQRVIDLKGRPAEMGMPILLAEVNELADVSMEASEVIWRLAWRFWPGSLTLIVCRSSSIPDPVTGGRDTLAVRVPDHPVPRELVRRLGRPITGTSANLSGLPPAVNVHEVSRGLAKKVDMIVTGGNAPQGVESTILDVTGAVPLLVRRGAVPEGEIRGYLMDFGEELAVI